MEPVSTVAKQDAKPDDLIKDEEVSQLTGVTTGTLAVWRATARYPLPYVKVGRNVRYRRGDVAAFLESRTVRPAGK